MRKPLGDLFGETRHLFAQYGANSGNQGRKTLIYQHVVDRYRVCVVVVLGNGFCGKPCKTSRLKRRMNGCMQCFLFLALLAWLAVGVCHNDVVCC